MLRIVNVVRCETSVKSFHDLQDWIKCTLHWTSGIRSGECHILSMFVFRFSSFWAYLVPGKTFSVPPGFGAPEPSGAGHWHSTSSGAGHWQPSCRWRGGDVDYGFDRHDQLCSPFSSMMLWTFSTISCCYLLCLRCSCCCYSCCLPQPLTWF